ncbi:MAG: hypothetical protein L3J76_03935, partial [Candidatus Hydrothermae bacterium]|nr:hypothetical protein [Candidatus Hydrothermae bacterium]
MRRISWAVVLLGVGVVRAQVGTHVLQRLFLPVVSYRLASTATLLEDDLDRMLDPSQAGTIQGARVYTSLSDLFQGEQLFGNLSFHAYTLAGLGGEVLGVTPLGLVDKYKDRTPLPTSRPGAVGQYVLDSLHYFSTQGPGFPPDRRERIRQEETSEQWTEHRFLLAGVARPRWGVDVMMGTFRVEQLPFGTEALPFGNVNVLSELAEHPSGQVLYRRTLQGERSRLQAQDLWAVAAGFLPVVGMPLRLTIGLARWTDQVRDTSHYSGLEDRAPGGPLNQVLREGTQEQRMRWPEGVLFGEFRYDLTWTERAEGTLRAGLYRWSAGLQEGRTVLDTVWDARELLVDTAIQRLAFRAETTFSGDRSRLGGYVTWLQQYRYTRALFALGASFLGDRHEETLQQDYLEQTVERVTNG